MICKGQDSKTGGDPDNRKVSGSNKQKGSLVVPQCDMSGQYNNNYSRQPKSNTFADGHEEREGQ